MFVLSNYVRFSVGAFSDVCFPVVVNIYIYISIISVFSTCVFSVILYFSVNVLSVVLCFQYLSVFSN